MINTTAKTQRTDVALRMYVRLRQQYATAVQINDISDVITMGVQRRYYFHRLLPHLSGNLYEISMLELLQKDSITALVLINKTKKIPSPPVVEKLIRGMMTSSDHEIMEQRRKFLDLLKDPETSVSASLRENSSKILAETGDLRTAVELGLQSLNSHPSESQFLRLLDYVTRSDFVTSGGFDPEEEKKFARETVENLVAQIFEPPYKLGHCVEQVVLTLQKTEEGKPQALRLAVNTLR